MVEVPRSVAATRAPTTFFPCVDGVRALTTTAVVLHHTAAISGGFDNAFLGDFYARTETAVPVFFVVSGFVIYRPFVLAHLGFRSRPAGWRFLKRRFLRVYPAYLVALAGAVWLLGTFSIDGARSWFLYGSLTYIYSGTHQLAPIQPAWTVAVEVTFYLAIPAYAWLVARRPRAPRSQVRVELVGLAAMSALSVLYRILILAGAQEHWEMKLRWLPGWMDMVAVGMLFAILSAAMSEGVVRYPAWLDTKQFLWVCYAAAAVLYVVASKGLGLPTDRFAYTAFQYMLVQAVDIVFALLIVAPTVFGPQDLGRVRRFLSWRPIAFVGGISYGIYLWHLPLILEYYERRKRLPNTGHLPELFLVVMAACIAFATLSYYLVEKPIRRLAQTRGNA